MEWSPIVLHYGRVIGARIYLATNRLGSSGPGVDFSAGLCTRLDVRHSCVHKRVSAFDRLRLSRRWPRINQASPPTVEKVERGIMRIAINNKFLENCSVASYQQFR